MAGNNIYMFIIFLCSIFPNRGMVVCCCQALQEQPSTSWLAVGSHLPSCAGFLGVLLAQRGSHALQGPGGPTGAPVRLQGCKEGSACIQRGSLEKGEGSALKSTDRAFSVLENELCDFWRKTKGMFPYWAALLCLLRDGTCMLEFAAALKLEVISYFFPFLALFIDCLFREWPGNYIVNLVYHVLLPVRSKQCIWHLKKWFFF